MSILVQRNEGHSMLGIGKKLKILYNAVYYSLHRTAQTGPNQNRKRSGRTRCTTEQKDKYIKVSSLRNRCLTSLQLAASLNSTRKAPVSMSTVKSQLRNAGLLGRVAKKRPYLRLANKNKRLRLAKEHRHWTEEFCLEGQHPGVASAQLTLRLVFCRYYFIEAASWRLVRHLFFKLDTNVLVLLLSCAPGPTTPLSILVRASLRCSVKGVVHSIFSFLAISQNKNRLTSFRRKT